MDNNIWWLVIPIMPCSKVMYRTFTNMEQKEDDHGNGGEDDNNTGEEVDHEIGDTNEHEDEPAIGDVDFHEHNITSSGMDVFVDLYIQNVDMKVDSFARVDLIEDEIKT